MKRHVITIGREYGSGGRFVAQLVAERLAIPFYDKELIEMAAKKTGLSPEFIKHTEEHRASGFLYNLCSNIQSLPLNDQVCIAQSNIIKKIAGDGPCVIVGRCSDYVLSGSADCLHVFVHAPMDERIERCRKFYGIDGDEGAIRAEITKRDKQRASYYSNFTGGKWGAPQNYHMSISTSIGIDSAVAAIITAADGGE